MESRFKESPGYNCSFKAKISNTITTVYNLNWAQGIECKLDSVNAHGKKDSPTPPGSGTCG
jgi:hypothetical protein